MELGAVRVSLPTDLRAAHAARVVVLVTVRQDQEERLPHWVRLLAARTEEGRRFKLAETVWHAVILADDTRVRTRGPKARGR